jgi:diguanylate cyclase (GGDEF)-like protein/PAS domain S-box-containing protein
MFDLMPIARSTVIENMSDLMLVLDTRNCLVDFNPAAQEVFGLGKIHSGGIPVTTLLEQGLDFLQHCKNERERGEFTIGSAEHCRVYDVTFIPINARKKYFVGWMILMRDITTRKQAEDELRSAYTCLQTQLTEVEKLQIQLREQAIRDPLTGLFNRRYLEETLERELARAFRQQTLFTIIMLDIDHFKKVNDLYGHKAGDLILKNLGEYLLSHTRTEDIACRYGGEEFVLILPGMSLESAYQRAEQFRISFQAFRVKYNENEFGVTLSLGIAAYPEHSTSVEELVAMADLALYAAKAGGRNRTIIYKSTLVGA